MKVKVMYRNTMDGGDGWTYHAITVEIADTCPVCGGSRGKPHRKQYCEDGEWYTVDTWTNPCGHLDRYPDVIREYRRRHAVAAYADAYPIHDPGCNVIPYARRDEPEPDAVPF